MCFCILTELHLVYKDFIYLASTYNCVYLWSYTISIYIVFFLLNFSIIYTNFPTSTLSTLHIHTSPYIKWWKKTDENWRKGTFYFAFFISTCVNKKEGIGVKKYSFTFHPYNKITEPIHKDSSHIHISSYVSTCTWHSW